MREPIEFFMDLDESSHAFRSIVYNSVFAQHDFSGHPISYLDTLSVWPNLSALHKKSELTTALVVVFFR